MLGSFQSEISAMMNSDHVSGSDATRRETPPKPKMKADKERSHRPEGGGSPLKPPLLTKSQREKMREQKHASLLAGSSGISHPLHFSDENSSNTIDFYEGFDSASSSSSVPISNPTPVPPPTSRSTFSSMRDDVSHSHAPPRRLISFFPQRDPECRHTHADPNNASHQRHHINRSRQPDDNQRLPCVASLVEEQLWHDRAFQHGAACRRKLAPRRDPWCRFHLPQGIGQPPLRPSLSLSLPLLPFPVVPLCAIHQILPLPPLSSSLCVTAP